MENVPYRPVLMAVSLVCREWLSPNPSFLPRLARRIDSYIDSFSHEGAFMKVCKRGDSASSLQYFFSREEAINCGEAVKQTAKGGFTHALQWVAQLPSEQVPSEAVTKAAGNGHLSILEFMLNNDAGWDFNRDFVQMSYGEGGEDSWFESVPDLPEDWDGPGNVVRWGGQSMESAVRRRHYKVARWLKEYVPYESTEEELDTMVEIAVNDGAMEFAEYLMPADREILEYIHERAKPEAVEWVLEREDVKKNQDFGAYAIVIAAVHGNLDLMERVARTRNKRRKITRWPREWKFSIGLAYSRGNFEMVKWMMEHPLGPDACASLKDQFMFDDLLCEAAKSGSAELAGYLLDQGVMIQAPMLYKMQLKENQFDVLLFLRVNCPDIFTTEFGQEAKYDYSGDAARPGDYLIEEWLEENTQGPPPRRNRAEDIHEVYPKPELPWLGTIIRASQYTTALSFGEAGA
ncbi:Ankyrin repeat-containing domain [Phytophthora cactorum]|nr:Ankyrin repeat-containing domain [Phytophthora cactorum]